MTDCDHLTIQGLDLFATTVWAAGARGGSELTHVTLHSLRFDYPSAQKRMLGEVEHSWPTTLRASGGQVDARLKLYNCTFFGADAHPLVEFGATSGLHVENNLCARGVSSLRRAPCT